MFIVQPATIVRWHRQGFKLYWRWRSRNPAPGRPKVEREIRDLIDEVRRMVPGLALSTDVIVGFPGETEADFEATLAVIQTFEPAGVGAR